MRTDSQGFTLIEILLAISIGSLVLVSIYGIFSGVSRTSKRLEEDGKQYHQARIFFDRMGSELSSLRSVAVEGESVFRSGKGATGDYYLEFNTECVSPLLQQHGGASRVRYAVQRNDNAAVLMRSEAALNVDFAEAARFIGGVKSFKLRYFSQGRWYQEWLGKRKPPRLIEMTLELVSGDRVIPFRSSFVLPEVQ